VVSREKKFYQLNRFVVDIQVVFISFFLNRFLFEIWA